MTVITLSTVGYGEIHSLNPPGMILTMVLIFSGIVVFSIVLGSFARFVIEGEIRNVMEKRRSKREVSRLKNHYIICGYGRIGRVIADELHEHHVPFVVVDSSPLKTDEVSKKGYPAYNGDSVNDEVLLAAGIMHAKGLIAAVGSPADNVYITISAKALKPDIFVMGRAHDDTGEKRLRSAGADQVVCPYSIGGRRMANIILRPAVVEFLDLTVGKRDLELAIEEMKVQHGSYLIGKTIIDSEIRTRFGVIIVAILRPSEKMVFNPPPQSVINENDTLIALGQIQNLKALSSAVS
ncbi:MAG: NAD-binding protein [Deltaproteobacteria bacterium]|nr:NAD-binding protein [Candidatus Zymogenaceae bacterium]